MPFPFDGAQPSLPPPPGASFYIEVVDFDKDEDLKQLGSKTPFIGATWKFNREQGPSDPPSSSSLSWNLLVIPS